MTDVTAPSSWYLDLQIPSILRRLDGRVRPSPARVPELVPSAPPEPRHSGEEERELGGEVPQLFQAVEESALIERDELRIELVDLKRQIPALRLERDELRMELVDLNNQIPALRRERDELLAAGIPLIAEVTDLQSKQQQLISLRSEIQALRRRKSSLEKSITGLRRPTEMIKRGRTENRKFDDS